MEAWKTQASHVGKDIPYVDVRIEKPCVNEALNTKCNLFV